MAKNPTTEVSALLGGSNSQSAMSDQLTTIASQLQELQTINQSQMASIEANTSAITANTGSKGSSTGASTAGSVENTLLDVLGSGLSPLISGLVSLFGGGGSGSTTAVTPYIQPLPVNLSAGFSGSSAGGASGVDYGEGGQPRQTTAASAQQQITVQVQAMDSQSFLDRSNDIAAAVRKAMLETSTLNDVIRGFRMANFPALKTGAVAQYGSDRSRLFSTQVLRFMDGSEQRFPGYGTALLKWVIRLDLLDESELENLELFFEDMGGRVGSFSFTDPWDGTVYPSCSLGSDELALQFKEVARGATQVVVKENRT